MSNKDKSNPDNIERVSTPKDENLTQDQMIKLPPEQAGDQELTDEVLDDVSGGEGSFLKVTLGLRKSSGGNLAGQ